MKSREFIRKYCWLINPDGNPNAWYPIDELQEHNVRDIKVIFAILGPFATWEYIQKISASIPCQRKVKNHVEMQINHYQRGKSHTSPNHTEDVKRLQNAYKESALHVYHAGRLHESKDKVPDYVGMGSQMQKLIQVMKRWSSNRLSDFGQDEDFEDPK